MTFGLLTKSYSEIYGGRVGIQKLTEDQLFGAKIKITVIEQAADGSRTRTERTWYQYRWVDVVDANQSVIQRGDTAAFMKTLADGTGNFIQQKLILSHIPAGVDYRIAVMLAASTALRTLALRPEVLSATSTSPGRPWARTWRA